MRSNNILKLALAVLIPLLAGFLGSIATSQSVDNWFVNLNKPFFNPPNWLFGPVWTLLYIFMGISLYLFWQTPIKKKQTKEKNIGFMLFFIQLILNTLWSVIFFGFRNILFAFIQIIFLLGFIFLTIKVFYKFKKSCAYLLIPYFLWVCFATILNGFYLLSN